MEKVLISGGSGLVGTHLSKLLISNGYQVVHLSRSAKKGEINSFVWNVKKQFIDEKAFEGIHHIIHLAGAGIADKPWSDARKKEILESRTESAKLLFNYVSKLDIKLKSFVSASGIGWYGNKTDSKIYTETEPVKPDYVAQVCYEWEKSVQPFSNITRLVILRTGIVLSTKGGALPKLDLPIKLWVGSALGNGKQFMPWIHIEDLCQMYLHTLKDTNYTGIYNATISENEQVTNSEMVSSIGKALNKPVFFPNVPAFILKLILGNLSSLVLQGSRVSTQKIEKAGFKFKFQKLDLALKNLYSNKI